MKITVVIGVLNDPLELSKTVQSCLETTTSDVEVVIVDDCSAVPVSIVRPQVRVHRNKRRLGVGPSRHIGACLASGEIIFIVDSHCRFTPGWDAEVRYSIQAAPHSLTCGSMIGFDSNTPFEKGKPYFGATWNFAGPDRNKAGKNQVFECVWQPDTGEGDFYAIPAPMGANYLCLREDYIRLGGLQFLRFWGLDEGVLSLKFWLCGGGVMLNKNLKIGHRFRIGREKVPFDIPRHELLYNRLFCIYTLLPRPRAELLASKIPGNVDKTNAMKELVKNWAIVEAEYHRNCLLSGGELESRFASYLQRFNLSFPT